MTPWFLLSPRKTPGHQIPQRHRELPFSQSACMDITSLLDETVHVTGRDVLGKHRHTWKDPFSPDSD